MTEEFKFNGGDSKSIREAFLDRKTYKESASLQDVQMLDTWYQYPNYGLLDHNYRPVVVAEGSGEENLREPDPQLGVGTPLLPFVRDAFTDFRNYYVNKTRTSNLDFPIFIGQVEPAIGYISFEAAYKTYLDTIRKDYMFYTLEKMNSYQDFHEKLLEIIELNIERFPVTRSGFLLSDKCPINVSGMCVELTLLDYEKDAPKADMLNNYEFKCFAEVANSYGFYIDKNVPWRLIANLESSQMRSYINRYRPDTDFNVILEKTFRKKTEQDDVASVINFYRLVFLDMVEYLEVNRNFAWNMLDQILHTLKIRMLETGIDMNHYTKNRIEVENLFNFYRRSQNAPLYRACQSKIGDICAEKISKIYLAKSKINSYTKTTLKDYM